MNFASNKQRLLYRFGNAKINEFPFPHFYLEDIFDPDFYKQLLKFKPKMHDMQSLADSGIVTKGLYKERLYIDIMKNDELNTFKQPDQANFWRDYRTLFDNADFMNCLVDRFKPYFKLHPLLKEGSNQYQASCIMQFSHDEPGYSIGPHSDTPHRMFNILFYLPEDDTQEHLGTSLYVPIDRSFTCAGGPHYKSKNFDRIATMPYRPNSAICFLKTYNSFHGVEPLTNHESRDIMMYYLKISKTAS